ncbi:calcium-binding protein [Pseudophaeobacter leonis]|uniref:calcium-binding protein n=1 Tax=Pseudophaeobacter leonis TaxID=1144477 RepID=UPI0009F3AE17|nr:calcium-binding protein [Pseudophaeobacter leonis]
MAIFNGTPGADQIAGTNEDDIITGIGGADDINGAGGNDDIDGGAAADIIVGGDGDDTIDGGAAADNVDGEEGSDVFAAPDAGTDTIDGGVDADGDDIDVLVTDLADGDDLIDGGMNVAGHLGVAISNIEEVKVTNASDFMIELGTDAFFGIDQTLTSTDYVATVATDADLASYDGTTHAVAVGAVTHLESAGITINGTSYAAGDTHTTANGGTVAITFNAGEWELAYTALQQSSITANSSVEDEVLDIQITENDSGDENVVTVSVTLDSAIGNVIDLSGETGDFRIEGDAGGNDLTTGDGNDTVIGGDGADTITLNDGDNIVWAGSADTGADVITIDGDGSKSLGWRGRRRPGHQRYRYRRQHHWRWRW